ncbi:MAG: BamA/TamA family outer membrane protein [Bacteroidota bacterium]
MRKHRLVRLINQISLFAGIFLSSCLGSKFLEGNDQILAKQKIKGISGGLRDQSYTLLPKQKNTRFFSYPFTHLAHIYQLGENGVVFGPKIERKKMRLKDKDEIYRQRIQKAGSQEKKDGLRAKIERITKRKTAKIEKKKDAPQLTLIPGFDVAKARQKEVAIEQKYDQKVASAKNEKQENRLRARKARKLDKKQRKINQGNQLMRWGEPLSIYSSNEARIAANNIQNYLYSKGYFKAEVNIDTARLDSLKPFKRFRRRTRNWFSRIAGAKHRYINLHLNVEKKSRYVVDSIQFDIKDPGLAQLLRENSKNQPLKKGFYDQNMLAAERDHIYKLAIDNGYYEFSKQFITFKIDSTQLGRDTLMIREIIFNPEGRSRHKIFEIDSIIFYSEASVRQSVKRSISTFDNITFSFGRKRYPERILDWRIPMEVGDKYSRSQTIETQRQLSFLDNFKFVNINYDTTGNTFIANIFTSPFERFQTSSEFGLSSTQGSDGVGNPGPFFNVNLKNRNTFNLLEVIGLDFNAKLQDLSNVSGDIENELTGAYTSRQIGGELSFSFPQFVFPIGNNYQNQIGKYNPKTRFSFGVIYEDRISEYRRLEYNGAIAYSWQIQDRVKYTITPAKIRWIDSQNTDSFQAFIEELIELRNAYANAFRPAVVNSSSFERIQNFGAYASGSNGAFLRTYFEFGGHMNSLISGSFFGDELEEFIYIKTNVDFRKIHRLSSKYNLAYRLNIGYARPFGSNRGLPYDGYFYAGGSSSIRGWRPRRLGPGSFATFIIDDEGNPTSTLNDEIEQPGEVLIESSIELRRDLVGFVEGALFLDAGNVWRIENNTDDTEFDAAVFRPSDFINQVAVAGGAGVRFDLQFLILRLDLGIKMVDPAKDIGSRFLGRNIFDNFGDNTEINIGIGYPF